MTDRQTFMGTLAGGLLAAPLAAEAQQPARPATIGVLAVAEFTEAVRGAIRDGLRDQGYVKGQAAALAVDAPPAAVRPPPSLPARCSLAVPIAAGVFYPWTGVLLSPIIASVAMTLSSVSVIGNALRLRRVQL